MSFSQLVSELGPPPEKVKSKKKKKKKKRLSDFGPPLLRIPGHAPAKALICELIKLYNHQGWHIPYNILCYICVVLSYQQQT